MKKYIKLILLCLILTYIFNFDDEKIKVYAEENTYTISNYHNGICENQETYLPNILNNLEDGTDIESDENIVAILVNGKEEYSYSTLQEAIDMAIQLRKYVEIIAVNSSDEEVTIPENVTFKVMEGKDDLTFNITLNKGVIEGGTFNCDLTNDGDINGGTFNQSVINNYCIIGGVFNGYVENNWYIEKATLNNKVLNKGEIYSTEASLVILGDGFLLMEESTGMVNCEVHTLDDNYRCILCKEAYIAEYNGELHYSLYWLLIETYQNAMEGVITILNETTETGDVYVGEKITLVVTGREVRVNIKENYGTIIGGTFNNFVSNSGTIENATINSSSFINKLGGVVSDCTFNTFVTNEGTINGSTFNTKLINSGKIYNNLEHQVIFGEDLSYEYNSPDIYCELHFGGEDTTCQDYSICNLCFGSYGQLKEHQYLKWNKIDDKTHRGTCSCYDFIIKEHNFDEGKITKESTHTETGEMLYTCLDCGFSKTTVIEKLEGHNYGDWEKVDENKHKHTCECGVEELLEHNYNEGEIIKESTHTENGEMLYACQACSSTKTTVIEKTEGHNYGDWEKVNESEHKHMCECGEIETKEHQYNTWEKADEITHKHICECGHYETEVHQYSEWTITKESTETEKGLKTKNCECGHDVTVEIPMLEPTDLSGGAIAGIIAGVLTLLGGLFSLYWFVLR